MLNKSLINTFSCLGSEFHRLVLHLAAIVLAVLSVIGELGVAAHGEVLHLLHINIPADGPCVQT